ncbi:MAG TPA: RNA polymerase sporulation sigma factor SigK [Candidatus Avimonas sp.]|jgi:RNA polymerase sporulation-specific sigma factor|nr:RNA polymerase sporulation sigma factor SigK [Candidatus Avimonas sp.]HQA16111.1 RNA polymerase sporulation sigma factor SigK [Candidatus Avimonas sp.]HQD38174.1 RNA polymerase sporulation sigma factor SigK [Candidatus Avimonas sp.]
MSILLFELIKAVSSFFYMLLYVENTGSFPKPLPPEEERRCLERFHLHGDINARNKLIEHNLRLVAHIIKKYYSTIREQDDLISIGTIGLIKAVNTFDYLKGARLATYASRCIENEILMHFRASKKKAQDVSFSEPIDTDKDGHPLTLSDVISEESNIIDDIDLRLNAEKLYHYIDDILEDRERKIIELRYGLTGEPLTQREVAKTLNISRSYVSRIEKKALEKLKKRFDLGDKKKAQNTA